MINSGVSLALLTEHQYLTDRQLCVDWNVWPGELRKDGVLKTFKPGGEVTHDCQTGRWLTVFRAQWSPNPEAYPHFTVRVA